MDNRLDIHDWVLTPKGELGKIWAITGSFAVVHIRDRDDVNLVNTLTFPIPTITKITKEVADVMRAV